MQYFKLWLIKIIQFGIFVLLVQTINGKDSTPKNSDQSSIDFTTHANVKLFDLNQCGRTTYDKIVESSKTVLYEFPFIAIIRSKVDNEIGIICDGSLISKRYVLAAAHCMQTDQGPIPLHSVVLGEHNTETYPDCIDEDNCADPIAEIEIAKQIPHPKFNMETAENNIGLLRLQQDARYSDSISPICLPLTVELQTMDLTKLLIIGWGAKSGIPTAIQRKVHVDVIPQTKCSSIYNERFLNQSRIAVDSTSICAYEQSCIGDGSSPAVLLSTQQKIGPRLFLYGISSASSNVCNQTNNDIPDLFTRVTSHMKWILDNISD